MQTSKVNIARNSIKLAIADNAVIASVSVTYLI